MDLLTNRQAHSEITSASRWCLRPRGVAFLFAFELFLYISLHVPEYYRDLITHWVMAFVLSFLVIGFSRVRAAWGSGVFAGRDGAISQRNLLAHLILVAISFALASSGATAMTENYRLLASAAWLGSGLAALWFGAIAIAEPEVWRSRGRATGNLWFYASVAGAAAILLEPLLRELWMSSHWQMGIDLTFWLVHEILRPFVPLVVTDWPRRIIGTERFAVEIAGACSGWEGLGLVAVFAGFSLWLSRREYRFPAALLLIPIAMLTVFLLNAVRIAVLIFIGHHGSPDVALRGFHSQAGWIAFSMVAFAITVGAPRVEWLKASRTGMLQPEPRLMHNPTVPFILPFAAILGTGMISMATSAGFEWLYPLRFFAALCAIWCYQREYSEVFRLSFDWFAPVAGAAVFVLWLALDQGSHADNGISAGLSRLPAAGREFWLTVRTAAAVSTVPLAEELAFRGFLLRRIISPQFEQVDYTRWSFVAVLGSSVAFGLLHGDRWLPGALAGVAYAVAMLRRGRLGDAVVAHSVTNAMLAVWVVARGNWYLW